MEDEFSGLLECAGEAWRGEGLADQTVERMTETCSRFATFCATAFGIRDLSEIGQTHAKAFVLARTRDGKPPEPATAHHRRSALRLLFRTGRGLGVLDGDPTLDLLLPPRSSKTLRPLQDDEIVLCRQAALHGFEATRQPAAWALAEASARSSEIAAAVVADLDLEQARVWLHGCTRAESRWGNLSDWGKLQLARRARALQTSSSGQRLVYEGRRGGASAQASTCTAVSAVLERAGLHQEPDVGPMSVVAWVATRVFERTSRIEAAARAIGSRSLDRTAEMIDHEWREPT